MKQIFTNIVTCKTSPYLPIDYTNSVCVKLSLIGHTQENNIYGKSFPNGQLCRRVLLAGAPIYMGKIYCTSSGSGTHRLNKFFHKLLLFHCNTRLQKEKITIMQSHDIDKSHSFIHSFIWTNYIIIIGKASTPYM